MNAEIMGLLGGFRTPHGVQQMGVGEHTSGMAGELGEQGKLDGGEWDGAIRHSDFVRGKVDGEMPDHEDGIRFRRSDTTQQGAQPGEKLGCIEWFC